MALTGGFDISIARKLHGVYWERNWAIKEVAKNQKVIRVKDQKYLINPISGFYYLLRSDKDRFSTLVQGTASYVFDKWVGFILDERPQLTAQYHDEIILCIRKGFREQCNDMLFEALRKTNEELKLNRELKISIQYGESYAAIH